MDGLFDMSREGLAILVIRQRLTSPRQIEAWLRKKKLILSDSTISRLIENPTISLRNPDDSDHLVEVANEFIPSFYTSEQRALRRSYLRALGGGNIEELINNHLVNARGPWLSLVRNSKAHLRDRLFYALLAFRIHHDIIHRLAPNREKYADDFNLSANLRERVKEALSDSFVTESAVIRDEVLATLAKLTPKATVEGVYGTPAPDTAKDGLRFFRLLVWNASLSPPGKQVTADPLKSASVARGTSIIKTTRLSAEILSLFEENLEKGFVDDMMWGYSVFRHIILVNNSWVACQYAAQWKQSVDVAKHLIANHEKLIIESVADLKPINKDPSVWPGIAALVLSDVRDKALDTFCGRLRNEPELQEMNKAIQKLGCSFDLNLSYNDALEAMGV
jgi:hypothetical protein